MKLGWLIKGPLTFACLCFSGNGMPQAICHHTSISPYANQASSLASKFLGGGTRQAEHVLVAAAQYSAAVSG